MKRVISIFIFAVVFFGCKDEAHNEVPSIMGDLLIGKYQVGYQTLFAYDISRNAVPFSNWNGEIFANETESKGRQHQINIWYPAENGTGTPLKYDHYIHLIRRQTSFDNTEELRKLGEDTFIQRTNDLGNHENFTPESLSKLLDLDVYAQLEATPVNDQFPVVIFPNGSSPATQSIMAEFLASHGYVVVGCRPKGRFAYGFEVSAIGIETAVDDMEFVMSQVSQLPYANMDQVALMANAISSSVCAAAVARNDKIKAFISLEGGFPSSFEQELLNQSVFYQPENIQIPILVIYAPHPAIDPKYTYHLKYADRYYAHFPLMSEFAMLNYGMFDSIVPDIIGKHEGDIQKGFEKASELALRFLDLKLKNAGGELFDQDVMKDSENVIDTTFILSAYEVPPNIVQVKHLFIKKGFEIIDSIYQAAITRGDKTPFSQSFINSFRDWLAWKKDPEYSARIALYKIAVESYPESAENSYRLGSYALNAGDTTLALKQFEQALDKLDPDNSLDQETKSLIRQRISAKTVSMN